MPLHARPLMALAAVLLWSPLAGLTDPPAPPAGDGTGNGSVTSPGAGQVAATTSLADLDLAVRDADLAPQVTIRRYENRTVEAYSVNNNTYMLKITPAAGAPYYLVDEDGSGDMTWNRGRPELDTNIPQWTLLRW